MEKLEDFYLNLNKENFEKIRTIYRTKKSSQIIINKKTLFNFFRIENKREYYIIEYKRRKVFVKEFKKTNKKNWSIETSVKYQAKNYFLLRNFDFIPKMIFFDNTKIGIDFISGKTLKQLLTEKNNHNKIRKLLPKIKSRLEKIIKTLNKNNVKYDISLNNILINNEKIYFIDFDYSNRQLKISEFMKLIQNILDEKIVVKKDGYLYEKNISSKIKILFKKLLDLF